MSTIGCAQQVFDSQSYNRYPCARDGTVERDGKWYCWQHDPEAIKKRNDDRVTRLNTEWAGKNAAAAKRLADEQARKDAVQALVDLLGSARTLMTVGGRNTDDPLVLAIDAALSAYAETHDGN